jgi:hypothetical protein
VFDNSKRAAYYIPSTHPFVDSGAVRQSIHEREDGYRDITRGTGSPEGRICYERAEPLCHSLNHPRLLCLALRGQWRYSLVTDKMSATMQIAERVYSLAQEQNDPGLMLGAYSACHARSSIWVISSPRDNTRCVVFRSGAREASSLCGRLPYASRRLSVLWGHVRVASRGYGLLPSEHG